MKRFILLLAFLAFPSLVHAQGASLQQLIINNIGRPLAGVSVRVCQHSASPAATPCNTTLAALYSNVELSGSPIANPTVTDALGNLLVYVAVGTYDYTVSGNGFTAKTYTVTTGPAASTPASGCLTATGCAIKPFVSDAACYVTTNGNDANDGLSLGTAKLTVNGCLLSLPGGSSTTFTAGTGTIYLQSGTGTILTGGTGAGIDLVGSNDPHWANTLLSCSRASSVVTLTFNATHNYLLSSSQQITVYATTGGATSFNGNFTITGGNAGAKTVTYAQTGPNESCTGSTGSVIPLGFLHESGSVNFVAKGSLTASNSPGGTVLTVKGGIGSPTTPPAATLQLSGTNFHYTSDGINWNGCIPVALGVNSNYQNTPGAATFSTVFDHGGFSISFQNGTGCGPAMEIGNNVLWLQVKNSFFSPLGANTKAIDSVTRLTNTSTMVLTSNMPTGGIQAGDQIIESGWADTSYNGTFTVATSDGLKTITYGNLGADCASTCGGGGSPVVALGPENDRRAAILFNPNGNNSGIVWLENLTFNSCGGVRATTPVGSGGGSIIGRNIVGEGCAYSQPLYEAAAGAGTQAPFTSWSGQMFISDSGDAPPIIKIPPGTAAAATFVSCSPGNIISVQGPATTSYCPLNAASATASFPNVSPAGMGGQGLFPWYNTKAWIEVDDLRRNGSPVNVTYANLAATAPGSWTNVTGGALTITTGILDTLGGTGAANLTVSASTGEADSYSGTRTVKAGDYFFAGAWVKGSTTAGISTATNAPPVQITFSNTNTKSRGIGNSGGVGVNVLQSVPYTQDDGAYQWIEAWDSVNNNTTTSTETVKLKHLVNTGFPRNVFAPILIHVPISTISRYSISLTSVASGGGFAIFTASGTHQFLVNQIACINDVTDTTYNGCTQVLSVTSTTFTTAYAGGSTSSSGGTAYAGADSEAAEIAQGLTSYLNTSPVGSLCDLVGCIPHSQLSDHTGTVQPIWHIVQDTCTLGTSCSVTLTNSAVFTSSTSYTCLTQDDTAIAATKCAQTSGSAFIITGTGTDVIRYTLIGN